MPSGAGLSSSAAIECAVATAFNELESAGLSPNELVLVGQRAENEVVGAPTGILDQSASLLSTDGHAVFLDCRTQESTLVPLDLAAAGLLILVVDTKVSHAHATGGYAARRASCELGAEVLGVAALRDVAAADLPEAAGLLDEETFRRVRHIVTENQRVLDTVAVLDDAGPAAIGALLTASHASMRDDFEISCPELDLAVDTALAHGALGARMTGGGFGGSAIALIPVGGRGRRARGRGGRPLPMPASRPRTSLPSPPPPGPAGSSSFLAQQKSAQPSNTRDNSLIFDHCCVIFTVGHGCEGPAASLRAVGAAGDYFRKSWCSSWVLAICSRISSESLCLSRYLGSMVWMVFSSTMSRP